MTPLGPLHTSVYTVYGGRESADHFLIAHGYTGAIDLVQSKVVTFLRENSQASFRTNKSSVRLNDDTLSLLQRRGYLTQRDESQEREYVWNFAQTMHGRNSRLSSFLFFVAYDCNFSCPYCFERHLSGSGKGWSRKVMTRAQVDTAYAAMSAIRPSRSMHDNQITLIGGEPLLPGNLDIVSYIVEKGVTAGYVFGAVTNGYSLDDYAHILRPGMIQFLQVTFEGPREAHDRLRRHKFAGDTFNRILGNIDLALSHNVTVCVRINFAESGQVGLRALEREFFARGWTETGRFRWYLATFARSEHRDGVGEIDFDLRRRIRASMRGSAVTPLRSDFCGATNGMVIFDSYGDMYGCFETVGMPAYRIGTYAWSFAIDSGRSWDWWKSNLTYRRCFECKYLLFCGGGCPVGSIFDGARVNLRECRAFPGLFKRALLEEYMDMEKNWM